MRVNFSNSGTVKYKQQWGRKLCFVCTLCRLTRNRKGYHRTVMEQGYKQAYSEQVEVSEDFHFYRIYQHLTINLLLIINLQFNTYIFSHNLEIYCGK